MFGLAPLAAFTCTFLFLYWLLRADRHWLPMDRPNSRSLHAEAIPRIGGVAILAGLTSGVVLAKGGLSLWLTLALALALISFLDDRYGLPAWLRFVAHCGVAALFVAWALPWTNAFAQIAGALAIVWMTNLYNFMDGSDGLAGGMAVFGFGAYALLAWRGGDAALAGACLSIAAAALAFLRFNFHPARVFMGDSGSIPLGFLAAALGILGWQKGLWSPLFPLLVFSPFIVDATLTLGRRAFAGERLWQAHHSHYYQRLVRLGWGHRGTALAEYAAMLVAISLAWAGEVSQLQVPMLVLAVMLYLAAALWVDRRWQLQGDRPA